MKTEGSRLAAIPAGATPAVLGRLPRVVLLVIVALLAIPAASAQAHSVGATATCKAVTFNWSAFSASGGGNGGVNAPRWTVVFKPTTGASTTKSGQVSFAGRSFSLTVPLPQSNGTVTASSSWTSAQTRDGHSASKSSTIKIANCPVVPPVVPPVPPPSPIVPGATSLTQPALTTIAASSSNGGGISDTAILSGGSAPTGTITFTLYAASDTACSTVLGQVSSAVDGNGSYVSPTIPITTPGAYQWIASYGGDDRNLPTSGACNDPAERSTVNVTIVKGICVRSIALRGVSAAVKGSMTVHVPATGVKRVSFYLDGRWVKTVKRSSRQRYSLAINARRLKYGHHRLRAKVTMRDTACASAQVAGEFVRVRPRATTPRFAG